MSLAIEGLLDIARRAASRATGVPFEDAWQEALAAILTARPRFDPLRGVPEAAYLYGAARYAVSTLVRRDRKRPMLLPEPSPLDSPEEQARVGRLREEVRNRLLYLVGADNAEALLEVVDERGCVPHAPPYRRMGERIFRDRWMAHIWRNG